MRDKTVMGGVRSDIQKCLCCILHLDYDLVIVFSSPELPLPIPYIVDPSRYLPINPLSKSPELTLRAPGKDMIVIAQNIVGIDLCSELLLVTGDYTAKNLLQTLAGPQK